MKTDSSVNFFFFFKKDNLLKNSATKSQLRDKNIQGSI